MNEKQEEFSLEAIDARTDCLVYVLALIGEDSNVSGQDYIIKVKDSDVPAAFSFSSAVMWFYGTALTNYNRHISCLEHGTKGSLKEDRITRKKLSRALCKCELWVKRDWSAFDRSPDELLSHPLCGALLLDRLLRQESSREMFIVDICHGHNNNGSLLRHESLVGFSVVDIYFAAALIKWFSVLFANRSALPDPLVSVLKYVQRVRQKLMMNSSCIPSGLLLERRNIIAIALNEDASRVWLPPFLWWPSSPEAAPVTRPDLIDEARLVREAEIYTRAVEDAALLDIVVPSLIKQLTWPEYTDSSPSQR